MNLPIELREYFRRWQREDYTQNLSPIKLQTGSAERPVDIFVRVGLQFRCLVKNPDRTLEWSEWQGVPVVLEGYEKTAQEKAALVSAPSPEKS
jgi:hypothetical protein